MTGAKILNLFKKALICQILIMPMMPALALPILVVGHKNPETQFALDFFKLEAPQIMLKVANRKVILVDHNTYSQAPDDIKQAEIVGIVDHHSLGDISTDEPIEVLIKPVGCTNTIIWQLYQQAGIPIPASIAGVMLTAILSDTLAFKSPTTTEADQIAAKSLASIAGVKDLQQYAQQMFLAGEVDLKTASIDSLLHRDFKSYVMSGHKVGIAQLSAFNFERLKERKNDFYEEMQKLLHQQGYQTLVIMLTDVQSMGSEVVLAGAQQDDIAKAFNMTLQNHSGWAAGVMSRKKQVVPLIEMIFKNK